MCYHPSGNFTQEQLTNIPCQETGSTQFWGSVNDFVKKASYFPCSENWKQHEESCYHFYIKWKIWPGTIDYCTSLGSKLLKIENKEELVISFLQFPEPASAFLSGAAKQCFATTVFSNVTDSCPS
uniref:C-type lectin domain-containing protein n=1 Tax=Terrapene triunguis TaxID=2587831 RepID=A0A674J1G9_9SAUR